MTPPWGGDDRRHLGRHPHRRLKVGNVVLCDGFRHPAALAKQATTLAEATGGRFELGRGSGSMPDELVKSGISTASPRML